MTNLFGTQDTSEDIVEFTALDFRNEADADTFFDELFSAFEDGEDFINDEELETLTR